MKKVFTLLMLLVAFVTGMQAADVITFAGATTKDAKTEALTPTISSSNSSITLGACASTCSTDGYIITTADGKTTVLGSTTYYLSQPYQNGSKKYWKDAGASFYGTFTIPGGYSYVMKGLNHALAAQGTNNFTAVIAVKDATSTKYATSSLSVTRLSGDGAAITSTAINLPEADWVTLSAGTYTINVTPSNSDSSTGKYFGIAQVSITGDLVAEGPAITTQPQSAAYATGDPISPLTVVATASAGDLEYQWYTCDDAEKTNAVAIGGATSASYTPTAAGFYYVNVADANGDIDSDVAEITISEEEAPTINVTGAPADDVLVGTEVILTATTTGTPTPTVTWYDGDTDEEITTGATYTVPTDVAGTFSIYAVASNGVEPDATSAVQTIVVKEQAATPTFTPNGGYFQGSQDVTVNCDTEDATLQYSTDGGATWTEMLTKVFTVTETTTVQVKATKAGYIDSEIATATFTLINLTPQADVTESVTWDWSTVTNSSAVDFSGTDLNNADVTYANIPAYGYTAVTGLGNEAALLMNGQRAYNNANGSKHCQVNYLKFNTTVPGSVTVEYANTGGNAARTVNVNGTKGTQSTEANNDYKSESFDVEAGEVTIMGVQVSDDAAKMVRIRKVVFTADNGKEDSDLAVDPAETSVNMEETTDVVYTTSSTGAVTVETSDATVATATVDQVNKTITITGVAAGTATITVSQESDDTYNAGSQEIAVTVINPNIKYVYDATGLTDDEFILTKHNFGGEYGMNPDNEFVTASTGDWVEDKEYGDYSGTFYNMSKTNRYITFKVKGAENFRLGVQNSTSGRTYTVKVGEAAAQEITHVGGGVKFTDIFETGTTDEVTIVIAGGGSSAGSVYPVAIQFNVQTSENIAFSDVTTYVTKHALDFTEVTELSAYAVTQIKTTSVATEKVGQVPAGTPLLIKADGAVDVDVPVIDNAASITNLLLASDGTVEGDGETIFAYSKNGLKFKKVASTVTIPEGKAYLVITTPNAGDAFDVDFEGEATAITNVNGNANSAAPVKVVTAKGIQIGKFNVAGQQVK